MTHIEAVKAIVHFGDERAEAFSVLLTATQSEIIYSVNENDVRIVLDKVINHELDIDELEMWAQLLELREDIDTQQVEGVLFALGDPKQMGELTMLKIKQLRQIL